MIFSTITQISLVISSATSAFLCKYILFATFSPGDTKLSLIYFIYQQNKKSHQAHIREVLLVYVNSIAYSTNPTTANLSIFGAYGLRVGVVGLEF